jgi:uncharacterized protein
MSTEKRSLRVLSIDGGGIRGIIPARLLDEIERRTRKPISALFDLIAGTSTGGILALALVKPDEAKVAAHSAADMVNFYEELGPTIFSKTLWHRLASVGGLFRSRYPDSPIETVLARFFGETRLKDALTPVFIPSYELERRSPFFFRSTLAQQKAEYDFSMYTAARSTSAAPTYFPPEQVDGTDGKSSLVLIDGGVFANNPAACAFAEARAHFPFASSMTMVSFGTGAPQTTALMTNPVNWGVAQWARPILDTVLDGVSDTVDFQLSQLLPAENGTARYFRIQPELSTTQQAMDNAEAANLKELKTVAERTIQSQSATIDQICRQLE